MKPLAGKIDCFVKEKQDAAEPASGEIKLLAGLFSLPGEAEKPHRWVTYEISFTLKIYKTKPCRMYITANVFDSTLTGNRKMPVATIKTSTAREDPSGPSAIMTNLMYVVPP